jgi:hypothetical protein
LQQSAHSGIRLEAQDMKTLSEMLVAFAPTAIVLNRTPDPAMLDEIRLWCPNARFAIVAEGSLPAVPSLTVLGGESSLWDAFLGLKVPDGLPLLPDFGFEPANVADGGLPLVPTLCIGPSCTYSRSIRSNPCFEGVHLGVEVRDVGCAFCEHFALDDTSDRFTYKTLREQFESLRRTCSFPPGRLTVRLVGDNLIRQFVKVVDVLTTLDLPALDLALECRTDHVVLFRRHLAAALKKLADSHHRIHFCLVEVENFARPELERMNKGVNPLLNLEAIRTLLELEQTFPDSFEFRTRAGLRIILYTPWTTLNDLSLNLRLIRTCGMEGLTGKAFSRMRLTPVMAMTALARRDGLLVDEFPDRVFETATTDIAEAELPWRFAFQEVEAACGLLARLFDGRGRDEDPIGQAVSRAVAGRDGGIGQTLDLAIQIIDAARRAVERAETPLALDRLLANVVATGPDIVDVNPDPDPAAGDAPLIEVGRKLGYPDCCIAAYMAEPQRDNTSLVFLKRRLAAGSLDPAVNPWPMLHATHVPCRADCESTRQRMNDVWRGFSRTVAPDTFARIRASAAHPWLVAVEPDGVAIELVPDSSPGERFRYSPGLVTPMRSDVVEAALNANEIALEPERTQLFLNGRLVADLSVRAWVWWHERPLQVDFWSRALEIRERMFTNMLNVGIEDQPRLDASREFHARMERLARWMAAVDPGLEVTVSKVDTDHDEAAFRVRWGSDTLVLVATPDARTRRPLFRFGTAAFFYREPTGLEAATLRSILNRLGAALDRVRRYQSVTGRQDNRMPEREQRS